MTTPVRTRQVVPSFVAALSIGCAVGAVALHQTATRRLDVPVHLSGADLLLAVAFPVVGAAVLAHQRSNRVGWLLLSAAAMGPYLLASSYAALDADSHLPGGSVAAWISVWGYQPYFVVWALVPLHFPDGRLPSPRWRPVRRVLVALIAASTLARMFAPVHADVASTVSNPVAGPHWLDIATLGCALTLVFGGGVVGLAAVAARLRVATGVERRRLQWLVLGVAWLLVTNLLGSLISAIGPFAVSDAAFVLGMAGLLATIAVGVVRHQLFDIGAALSRTIVYVALTLLMAVAAVAVVSAASSHAPGARLALGALAIVALIAAGANDQLQRLVDRMVFGRSHDPYDVLAAIQRRLVLAAGPLDALRHLVDAVRDALAVRYVALVPHDARLGTVDAGTRDSGPVEALPLSEGGSEVGTLLVATRGASVPFTRRERKALVAVAARAGELVRRAELTSDLQAHREQLVAAREAERRRVRRDLHDGVGPALAAIAMQLDRLVEDLVDVGSGELAARAGRSRDGLRTTVASVRTVIDGLRPGSLDDMGLSGALAELVAGYAPVARLEGGPLPPLGAATEAAAYLIAAEAITNAMRHAACSTCVVRLDAGEAGLRLEVADDGVGLPEDLTPGVGLASIRDRAAEVGGRVDLVSSERGTSVRVLLPLGVTP